MGQYGMRTIANWFGNIKMINTETHCTLKNLRIEKGFETATALAKVSGLNPSNYSQIENGAYKPNFKNQKKIADALGVAVEEIFPAERESKVRLTVIHESPSKLEVMLRKQYGDKLMPRKCL
ncbi:MAG: helix-turn-helix protein [Bacillales bacterium]|jgi:DNA-binding XRE family transcriptional regulator|nr:helix-turn-helix protein [Bacillales bacterium]